MKTQLLNVLSVSIMLFLIPTVNFGQASDLAKISPSVSTATASERINIYPNPTCGNITMQFNSTGTKNYIVNISNIIGKLMFSDKISAVKGVNLYEIDFSKETKGIYLLTLENDNVKEQKRFVVQ